MENLNNLPENDVTNVGSASSGIVGSYDSFTYYEIGAQIEQRRLTRAKRFVDGLLAQVHDKVYLYNDLDFGSVSQTHMFSSEETRDKEVAEILAELVRRGFLNETITTENVIEEDNKYTVRITITHPAFTETLPLDPVFFSHTATLGDMVKNGTVTSKQFKKLCKIVASGENIFVASTTGGGKTTMLRALLMYQQQVRNNGSRTFLVDDTQEIDPDSSLRFVPTVNYGNITSFNDVMEAVGAMNPTLVAIGEIREQWKTDWTETGTTIYSTVHGSGRKAAKQRLQNLCCSSPDSQALSGFLVVVEKVDGKHTVSSIKRITKREQS